MKVSDLEKLEFVKEEGHDGSDYVSYEKTVGGRHKDQTFNVYLDTSRDPEEFWCVICGAHVTIKSKDQLQSILELIK